MPSTSCSTDIACVARPLPWISTSSWCAPRKRNSGRPARLLVLGGGIGGLAAELPVARDGHAVRVLEQAPEFAEIGAGLQVGPNASRVLDRLGVLLVGSKPWSQSTISKSSAARGLSAWARGRAPTPSRCRRPPQVRVVVCTRAVRGARIGSWETIEPGFVELRAPGGALADEAAVPNAVVGHGAPWALVAAGGQEAGARLDALADALVQWSQDERSANLLAAGQATTPAEVRAAYDPARYERLAQLKRRHEPQNLFRVNHTIAPAASTPVPWTARWPRIE
ncbi:hypothetical protein AB0K15_15770 [Amycolatopsis sp. NPDC049253]|uniref:hypothetical protein n=1 Tax=Amycolatopsis sp. NPDC049253 TaxID=3155274 RepID=UPI00343D3646